jgi:signal transduction histidine kinase
LIRGASGWRRTEASPQVQDGIPAPGGAAKKYKAPGGEDLTETRLQEGERSVDAPAGATTRASSFFAGLSGRLLLLTVGFILFAELIIYPPLAAGYRNGWMLERTQAAQIAALAVEAAPDGRVSEDLSRELLARAQVISVAVEGEDFREMILAPSVRINGPLVPVDLRDSARPPSMMAAFEHLLAPKGRFLQIVITPSMTNDTSMEVIVPEAALRADLVSFSRTLLVVSLIISAIVGALIYFTIYRLVVRPMKGLTSSIIRFAEAPEGPDLRAKPGGSDEIRRAYVALQNMQQQVSATFRQRKRLADLGEAVAKINHDLRNSLSAAQIVSESLAQSDDPRVKRAAPRLERAIERAIGLAEATLRYGRAEPPGPNLQPVNIIPAIEEAALEGLSGSPAIEWRLDAPDRLMALADPEHVHRIVANLVRNSARAIAGQAERTSPGRVSARAFEQGGSVIVEIADNGPGIPPAVMGRLFLPFSGSGSRDGAGLGLAIARELARGMKGELELSDSDSAGAAFTLRMPAG